MQRRNDHEVDQLDPVAPGTLESSAEYPMALFIDLDWRKQGKNSRLFALRWRPPTLMSG
jgi:hypothetical protein